jgi:Xaa-Pro aminopeptidase
MAKKNAEESVISQDYPSIIDTRLEQLKFTMEDDLKVDAIAITYVPNIRYLTNFSGSAATMFVTHDEIHFVTDDRYEEQIKDELFKLPNMKTHITRDPWQLLIDKKEITKISHLAFEADKIAYSEAVEIRNRLRPIKFKPAPDSVEKFTIPKSPEEQLMIQRSCDMAVKVYEDILNMIKPGVTEKELELEISYQTRKLGSEGDPFPIIVVSGPRSALPHGTATDRKIKKGDVVLMDFGCIVNGFVSDITRTVVVGKASKEQKDMYKLLVQAKEAAIKTVCPGMNGKTLDEAARSIIRDAGFGDKFQHSLGHGIGLVAHEKPIITFRKEDQIIPENAVIAIEPGIYLPDQFGMRVEDDVLVTRSGGKHFTKAPEELLVV